MSHTNEIPLTQGKVAVVSDADFDRLSCHRWHAVKAGKTFYAARRPSTGIVYMHRAVLGVEGGRYISAVDHINHDGLDNRRENLRHVSVAENARSHRNLFDGVPAWAVEKQASGSWLARISFNGEVIHLAVFSTERDARAAYKATDRLLRKLRAGEA
jgi:hypothetical protein